MTRWLGVLIGAVLGVTMCSAAVADSSTDSISIIVTPGGLTGPVTNLSATSIPLRVSGQLIVAFHGDPSTGCAALAACGYQGTFVFRPSSALITIERFTLRRHRIRFAFLEFDSFVPPSTPDLFARVIRSGGGVCADASQSSLEGIEGRAARSGLRFPLVAGIRPARCAGPVAADLAAAVPTLVLPARPHRGAHIDARASTRFASHGFAGTVTSTLGFTIGQANTDTGPGTPPGTRYSRIREVSESMRVTAARGTVTADVRGTAVGGVCVLVDSCGLTGTVTFAPHPGANDGFLTSSGPAKLPERDFLVALGLRSGHPRRGLGATGFSSWVDRGTVRADLQQGASCTDAVRLGSSAVSVVTRGPEIDVSLTSQADSSGASAGRTRCPGPEFPAFATLASGRVARSVFGHRTFSVSLHAQRAFSDDGYVIAMRGTITLTFKLGKVTSQVLRQPT